MFITIQLLKLGGGSHALAAARLPVSNQASSTGVPRRPLRGETAIEETQAPPTLRT
ncbi:hypothetical protein MGG_15858 [Pyricularia oryzae 70-15]|uniref:Uncharacterized protein n=4 Tax=Pyricularia oryzae TaxID=318829 RepID=G4MT53_PYRO7|nr:uncharacterized protein MGG_15858 [Pyricularia oryzae 70-15]ELQ34315.1 hypothetical protein OOU_Y34scaffold00773g28 [Pyricularia oryzae Y34]KAI7922632.1 hypothetical protein M0657_005535 [Pyricularia oryzae]EHA55518.1 hypothetical protein MGG_15858 [Pyricularia oryzae 70-15]KAI7924868.1 hypothetical protein M9X92_003580 [Pyricularia oryzae]QBZ57220.1 hypothetical protein PoMZ_02144 [Pyricularia oryzae]